MLCVIDGLIDFFSCIFSKCIFPTYCCLFGIFLIKKFFLKRTQEKAMEIMKSFKELMMKACTFIEAQIQKNMKQGNGFAVGNRVSPYIYSTPKSYQLYLK